MSSINQREILPFAKQTELAAKYFEEKLGFTLGQSQLKKKIDDGDQDFIVIDTRSAEAFKKAHIPGAVWVDADAIETQWAKFSKDKVNVVYCYGPLCLRGPRVCLQAAKAGFPVMELHGNFDGWADAYGFETEAG